MTVTLYEDMTYRLHIQFDCNGQSNGDSSNTNCDLSQTINVWIDYNDNGYDDNNENQILHHIQTNNNVLGNTNDLELYIPSINNNNIKTGIHRMRLTVIPSAEYQRECGNTDEKETREYTVNIVPKVSYQGKSFFFIYIIRFAKK